MDPVDALARCGGVAGVDRILTLTSRKRLRTAVSHGRVIRIHRGVYQLADAHPALVRAAQLGGVCSHLSAAVLHGWETMRPPQRPWITVPRHRKIGRRFGCTVVWADLSDEPGPVTGPYRTVLDCARRLPQPEALAIADSALRHRDVDHDELVQRAAQLRGPGAPAARWVADHASHLAANPFESALRALALQAGLEVVPQVRMDIGEGFARPDLIDLDRRVVIEADSWEWHGGRDAHARDCARYTSMTVNRWRVLRFDYDSVIHRPDEVLAVLADVARQRPATDH